MTKKLIFGNETFPVPEDMTLEEVQEWASEALPAIADATGSENSDGDYTFTKKAGTKGL